MGNSIEISIDTILPDIEADFQIWYINNDHNLLENRDLPNQHSMGSITGLESALDNRVDKTSTASQVYGTDSEGNQTTYDVGSFGQVDDVQVGGVSVVTNKIAELGTMAGETASNYSTTAQANELYADKANTYTKSEVDTALSGKQSSLDTTQMAAVNSGANATNIGQIATNTNSISSINELIPSEASSSNQLADKEFVNSSISTNTARFIGTFSSVTALEAYSGTVTNNDYAFVTNSVVTDNGDDWATFAALDAYNKDLLTNFDYGWVINGSKFDLYRFDIVNQEWVSRATNIHKTDVTLNSAYNRYKATVAGGTVAWEYEYTLNNSSFTASQWAAINSGITSGDVALIATALQPNDNISELTNDSGYITSSDLPTNYVTTDTAQDISAKKTFLGEKAINFKQSTTNDKLGFTLLSTASSNNEIGAFEYRPNTISNKALLNINGSVTGNTLVGFRYWGTTGTTVNVIAPKASGGDYYIPVKISDGTNSVTTADTGIVNISTLIPTVNNSTITFTQGGVDKGSFTLNQATGGTIALDAGITYTAGTGIDITSNVISVDGVTANELSIDTVVTQSSSNLITSGAVYDVVGDIETLLQGLR